MNRLITYRGFEIHVELTEVDQDMYSVTFQIKGHNVGRLGADGAVVRVGRVHSLCAGRTSLRKSQGKRPLTYSLVRSCSLIGVGLGVRLCDGARRLSTGV